mmetsp:Transcript_11816/g.23430  ORF Transcript_11816/g.23430 Transcript_11816/m.23430 type:complete len:452 (+) Transcript_11816:58-1413(+)
MAPISIRFEAPSVVPFKNYDKIIPPSFVNLKRSGTASTKTSCTTYDSSTASGSSTPHGSSAVKVNGSSVGSSYYRFPSYNEQNYIQNGASTVSYDNSSLTSRRSIETMVLSAYSDITVLQSAQTMRTTETMDQSNDAQYAPDLNKTSTTEESLDLSHCTYVEEHEEEDITILQSAHTMSTTRTMDQSNDAQYAPDLRETPTEEESLDLSHYTYVEEREEGDEYDDQIIETKIKNSSLSLKWDSGKSMALSSRIANKEAVDIDYEFELPPGILKSDITVSIDIDDEARSSRVNELDEEDLDVEILHQERRNSGARSYRKLRHRHRREFEETVRKGILDDLTSVYTATPKTAKLVLCVVISVLSDGTLEHTFWSGGRVGLTEIALQWVLFDPDDLQVCKRGQEVQKKDFGFGPLGLTKSEGQHYLVTSLGPRAANDIMRKVGGDIRQDLLAEF